MALKPLTTRKLLNALMYFSPTYAKLLLIKYPNFLRTTNVPLIPTRVAFSCPLLYTADKVIKLTSKFKHSKTSGSRLFHLSSKLYPMYLTYLCLLVNFHRNLTLLMLPQFSRLATNTTSPTIGLSPHFYL